MQPLNKSALKSFMQRFANFEGAMFQSVEIISATQMRVTLDVQDSAKEFDWVRLMLEFSEISDAKLMDDAKLSLIDLSEGITLLHESDSFAITFEHYETIASLKSSNFYIVAKSLKYKQTTI